MADVPSQLVTSVGTELEALAREALLLDRPLVDVEVTTRWDALDVLSLARRYAHIVQLTPTRWLVRVVAVGRDAEGVEADLERITDWAATRARGPVTLVVGEHAVTLS